MLFNGNQWYTIGSFLSGPWLGVDLFESPSSVTVSAVNIDDPALYFLCDLAVCIPVN